MNKLELRRELYSLRLKDGDSVQAHVKEMTEIFNGLSVIGDPVSDEDRVGKLARFIQYDILKQNPEVPKMEVVTERREEAERLRRSWYG